MTRMSYGSGIQTSGCDACALSPPPCGEGSGVGVALESAAWMVSSTTLISRVTSKLLKRRTRKPWSFEMRGPRLVIGSVLVEPMLVPVDFNDELGGEAAKVH